MMSARASRSVHRPRSRANPGRVRQRLRAEKMSLSIHHEHSGDLVVVRLVGRLVTVTSKTLEDHIAALLAKGQRRLVLDLAQVDCQQLWSSGVPAECQETQGTARRVRALQRHACRAESPRIERLRWHPHETRRGRGRARGAARLGGRAPRVSLSGLPVRMSIVSRATATTTESNIQRYGDGMATATAPYDASSTVWAGAQASVTSAPGPKRGVSRFCRKALNRAPPVASIR